MQLTSLMQCFICSTAKYFMSYFSKQGLISSVGYKWTHKLEHKFVPYLKYILEVLEVFESLFFPSREIKSVKKIFSPATKGAGFGAFLK